MGAGAEHLHGVRDARLRTQQVQRSCGEHGLEREEGRGLGSRGREGRSWIRKGLAACGERKGECTRV